MSNISTTATRTPYAVTNSTTGVSSSTPINTASSTTPVATASTTPNVSTTPPQGANVANTQNTGTVSASTTSAYGNAALNSSSKPVSSTTAPNSGESTNMVANTIERNGGCITIYTEGNASTTPSSQNATPNMVANTIERNGGCITIYTEGNASTTPSSSSTTPTGSSTTEPTYTKMINRVGGNIHEPHRPIINEENILEKTEVGLYGNTDVNALEKYSEKDVSSLLYSLKEQYLGFMESFFEKANEMGIDSTASIHIPIAKYTAPNASVELYFEMGKSVSSDVSLASIERSINEFADEVMDLDSLMEQFSVTYGNTIGIGMNSADGVNITYSYDNTEITINCSESMLTKLEMSIEKTYEDENGCQYVLGANISIEWDDDMRNAFETKTVNIVNENSRQYALDYPSFFSADELAEIMAGLFSADNYFLDFFAPPNAGYESIEDAENQMEKAKLNEKLNNGLQKESGN